VNAAWLHADPAARLLVPHGGDERGDGSLADAGELPRIAQGLEEVEGILKAVPRVGSQSRNVLCLEYPAELFPAELAGLLVEVVVQLILQVGSFLFRLQWIAGLGGLALALAGNRVMPLKHEEGAVLELLYPDDDALFPRRWGRLGS